MTDKTIAPMVAANQANNVPTGKTNNPIFTIVIKAALYLFSAY